MYIGVAKTQDIVENVTFKKTLKKDKKSVDKGEGLWYYNLAL